MSGAFRIVGDWLFGMESGGFGAEESMDVSSGFQKKGKACLILYLRN